MYGVIKSFADKNVERFWETGKSRGMPPANLRRATLRKLVLLDDAAVLDDLRVPPSNHLEALRRDRDGQYSIRINEQFRICFVWRDGNCYEVEIVDYH
ncbi:MAG: type II toxin-antitoxin system RelE/ParE family toxin [Terriglobales bacterium]|jgi:proteic killer suppression protein